MTFESEHDVHYASEHLGWRTRLCRGRECKFPETDIDSKTRLTMQKRNISQYLRTVYSETRRDVEAFG
jgi:hypothetical protein